MSWFSILKLRNRDVFTGKRTDPTFYRRKFRGFKTKAPKEIESEEITDRDGRKFKRVHPMGKTSRESKLNLEALDGTTQQDIEKMSYKELVALMRKIGYDYIPFREDTRNRNKRLKEHISGLLHTRAREIRREEQ
jgi:hypothetical protein|tara:strand:- start:265 stop:669 length:405 start_codon:yes stop_codon:yes gene_type:complete